MFISPPRNTFRYTFSWLIVAALFFVPPADLGDLRLLPDPPSGAGIGVLHRHLRNLCCLLLVVDENKSYTSRRGNLVQVAVQRKGSSLGRNHGARYGQQPLNAGRTSDSSDG
jgi:hypothetical protein